MSTAPSRNGNGSTAATMLSSAKLARAHPASKLLRPLHLGKDCDYDRELKRRQIERVKIREWIRECGLRVGGAF
jgi:hypothetical protein